jgi:phosphoribosyl 1,2-cyclic phosphodiesterase
MAAKRAARGVRKGVGRERSRAGGGASTKPAAKRAVPAKGGAAAAAKGGRRAVAVATAPVGSAAPAHPEAFTVRFWGVRGSLATPGLNTLRVGGNTSCVEVRCGSEVLVFDMGTGLKPLGLSLLRQGPVRVHLFVSHYHWDHIVGLPFFAPAYDPRSELIIHGATRKGRGVRQILAGQMVDPYFPVDLGVFNARLRFVPLQDNGLVTMGPVRLRAFETNHPGGVLAYRIDFKGRSMVYASDFEHGTAADDRLVEEARGADLMVYDAQYTPREYEAAPPFSRKGWGHSTWEMGATLARLAGVKRLALYHHEPERNDAAVEELAAEARKIHAGTFAAREGLTLEL